MEHRHFKRKPVNLSVQLVTNDGKVYDGELREISAAGMLIISNSVLPDRVKVVDVSLSDPDDTDALMRSQRMLLTRKQGRALGLCLMNENDLIDIAWYQPGKHGMNKPRKLAN